MQIDSSYNSYNRDIKLIKLEGKYDSDFISDSLIKIIPTLKNELQEKSNLITQDPLQQDLQVVTKAVGSAWNWLFEEEKVTKEVKVENCKKEIINLSKEAQEIQGKQTQIENNIKAIQEELKNKEGQGDYVVIANGLIKKHYEEYLENHIAWLVNLKEQVSKMNVIADLEQKKEVSAKMLETECEGYKTTLRILRLENENTPAQTSLTSTLTVTSEVLVNALNSIDQAANNFLNVSKKEEPTLPKEEPALPIIEVPAALPPVKEGEKPAPSPEAAVPDVLPVQEKGVEQSSKEVKQEILQPILAEATEKSWFENVANIVSDQLNKADKAASEWLVPTENSVQAEGLPVSVSENKPTWSSMFYEAISSAEKAGDAFLRSDGEQNESKAENILPSWNSISGAFSNLFASKEDVKFIALIESLKNGQGNLQDEDLVLLNTQMLKLKKLKNALRQQSKDEFKNELTKLIAQYPVTARTAIEGVVFIVGFALGGVAGAIAARMAAATAIKTIVPNESEDSWVGRISGGVAQSLGVYLINGVMGATVSAGIAAFQAKAPPSLQAVAVGGSVTYLSMLAGLPLPLSLPIGFVSMLAAKNEGLFKSISNDLKHAWKICTESPLKIVPEFCVFIKNQVVQSTWGLVKAIKDGKEVEAITRIAAYIIGAVGLVFSLGTLPLTLTIFYMVNKTYGPKYEGVAIFSNQSFREYILREFNSRAVKNAQTLRELLEKENAEHKEFCDQLDEYMKEPPKA
jgi:hypothetical protein